MTTKLEKHLPKSKSKAILIFLTMLFAMLIVNIKANAQINNEQRIIEQQDWITRQQQNKIEEDKRLKEGDAIKKERERKKKKAKDDEKKQKISNKLEKCFPIKEIVISGANSISQRKLNKITDPFLGRCFEVKILTELVNNLNSYYNKKGFVTAQVVVPKQNIQSGIVQFDILEGRIDKVILGKEKITDKMQKFTAFGGSLKGDVLDIADINQGIYQINRLVSNNAAMKIEPSENEGGANVIISNESKFPAKVTIGKDNLGNKFTGVQRVNFSGNFDNMLFLNDNINLTYSTNIHDDSQVKDIKSFSSSFSIPFGYNTISYDYSRSEFRGQTSGINGPSRYLGYSDRNNFSIDRVLLNNGNLRISGNSSITEKRTASYLGTIKQENSERRLTIGNLGLSISNYFDNGVNIYLKPSYLKGLKILNSKQDQKNLDSSDPKAQFEVFKLYSSISKKAILPKVNIPIAFASEFDGQFSKQTLFGSEQVSIGGYYSVRGFQESYITGDSGYNLRNKMNINLGSFITPFLTKKSIEENNQKNENFFSKNLYHLNKIEIEPFYDYGYAQNKYDGSDGRLSGAGVKTIFNSKNFTASLTYAEVLSRSKLITSEEKENQMLYFEISVSCC